MIGIKHRVWQSKLPLFKRQSPSTLWKKILVEQQIKNRFKIEGSLSRSEKDILWIEYLWREQLWGTFGIIMRAIIDHHDRHLIENIYNSKKMKNYKDDDFKQVQDYMKGKVLSCKVWNVMIVPWNRSRPTAWSILTGRTKKENWLLSCTVDSCLEQWTGLLHLFFHCFYQSALQKYRIL